MIPLLPPCYQPIVQPNGCWLWPARIGRGGYGILQRNRVRWQAHRYIWTFVNGPIPNGLKVLHKCDNPPCVNPAHLWLGTQSDNIQDMIKKGRVWRNGYQPKVVVKARI